MTLDNRNLANINGKDSAIEDISAGIFENSPNGIVVTDEDLCIKRFNVNAEKFTGMNAKRRYWTRF